MIDSTYAADALAWSVVWIGAGLVFRQWLAARPPSVHRESRR